MSLPEPRPPLDLEAATMHVACHPDGADALRAAAIRRGVPIEVHPSPYVPAGKAYAFDPVREAGS